MPRAPEFWRVDGVASRLLSPLGAVYGEIARRRLLRPASRTALPTIVVGGPTAGGDGKTPLVLALAALLESQGERPALLTRGYGGATRRPPVVVDLDRDDAQLVGDEALLLARQGLAIAGADRAAGAEIARSLGATILLLDDGFHSRRLAGDVSFLAIDSDYAAGNARCLPAGPLRAPLTAQFSAADALALIGGGAAGRALAAQAGKPVLSAQLVPDPQAAKGLAGSRVVAFAGIGRPEKFFRTLRDLGAEVVAARSFPDHRRFSAREIDGLVELRLRHRARLVTTEKDAMRLPAGLEADVLPIRLVFDDPAGVVEALAPALARGRVNPAS